MIIGDTMADLNITMKSVIRNKKNRLDLSRDELEYAFNGYLEGTIPDYQMSALLMAIVINGMTERETIDLTDIFIKSGKTFDLLKNRYLNIVIEIEINIRILKLKTKNNIQI